MPVADNGSSTGRQPNRRVEVIGSNDGGQSQQLVRPFDPYPLFARVRKLCGFFLGRGRL